MVWLKVIHWNICSTKSDQRKYILLFLYFLSAPMTALNLLKQELWDKSSQLMILLTLSSQMYSGVLAAYLPVLSQ